MLLRLLAVVAVFGILPLSRQARAVSNPPFTRTSTNSHLNSSPKSQQPQQQPQQHQQQKYARRSTYAEYPDEYLMYYPQEAAAAYPYYPYAEPQPYYPAEVSYYPKNYYPFDVASVPLYPYYYGLQSPYAYYPVDASERYLLEDDDRWYDNTVNRQRDSNADVNAAFLRNLIATQMYNDATSHGRNVAPGAGSGATQSPTQNRYGQQDIVYGEPVAYALNKDTSNSRAHFGRYVTSRDNAHDDKDVRELKSLIKSKKSEGRASRHLDVDINDISVDEYDANGILDDVLGELYYKDDLNEAERPPKDAWGALLFGDDPLLKSSQTEKPISSSLSRTTARTPTVTRRAPNRSPSSHLPAPATAPTTATSHSGQKEEAMLRPGKPGRPQRNSDSVFDTIRHLLSMDRALSQQSQNEPDVVPTENKRQPQKRYVLTEKSLTEELNALKKTTE